MNFNPLVHAPVKDVCRMAESRGLDLHLVGGYLRDSIRPKLTGRSNVYDFDFAVGAGVDAVEFARAVTEELSGHFVLLDNKNDTARVVLDDGTYLDFAGCVGGTIESDIKRRDFSINALAWSYKEPDKLIDLVGGVRDLEEGVIRVISEDNLIDDPLRSLRAFRFAAQTGCSIEPESLEFIKKHGQRIKTVASERTNYEVFLLMESKKAGDLLFTMAEVGLLEAIFPELVDTRKVTANQFHHLGLFEHSIECVRQTELYIDECPDWVLESARQELTHNVTRLAATKVACLLHDIGKPDTWDITEEGRHTFLGHDKLGATMTNEMGIRIRWSKPVTRFITSLVKWHLRPGHLFHQGDKPTEKAINRFYRSIGEDVPELMLLAFGDLGATRGEGFTEDVRQSLKDNLKALLAGYPDFVEREKQLPRLLSGTDVMEILSLKPGPVIGEVLEALIEAQTLEEVSDAQSARVFIEDYYRKNYL